MEEPDQAMAKAETKRVTFMELQEERENIINNNSHDGNNNEVRGRRINMKFFKLTKFFTYDDTLPLLLKTGLEAMSSRQLPVLIKTG